MQENNRPIIVLGLSGGMDSAALLGFLLEQGAIVHCCMFTYGSKHGAHEVAAAIKLIDFYEKKLGKERVYDHYIDLTPAFKEFSSNLLQTGGAIPEGHYQAENMKLTVVPNRNMIFASVMAGLAESLEAEFVALGVHTGDHAIYPDCRPEFVKALDLAVYEATNKQVQILTPLMNLDKAGILKIGLNQTTPVPYELTRTCYKDQVLPCGVCGSCNERIEAFSQLGLVDPVAYDL